MAKPTTAVEISTTALWQSVYHQLMWPYAQALQITQDSFDKNVDLKEIYMTLSFSKVVGFHVVEGINNRSKWHHRRCRLNL